MKRLLLLFVSLLFCTGGLPADSLWTETSISPLADRRALAVGDLLSVIVQENNSATKNQTKKTQKAMQPKTKMHCKINFESPIRLAGLHLHT